MEHRQARNGLSSCQRLRRCRHCCRRISGASSGQGRIVVSSASSSSSSTLSSSSNSPSCYCPKFIIYHLRAIIPTRVMPTRVVSGQGRATAARGQGSATAGRGPPGRATSGRGPPDRATAACRPGRQQHADKAGQQQPADEVGLGTTAARKSYIPSGYIKSGFVIDDELFASRAGDVEAKARRGGGTRGGGD